MTDAGSGAVEIGTRIADRYTVVGKLGAGGMGGVYEVHGEDPALRLALKLIRPQMELDARIVERFVREAKVEESLDHPGIVKVVEVVEHFGRPAIVMEYIDAPTLRQWLGRGRPALPAVRQLAESLLSSLAVAHRGRVVHRDLKPENIFVLTRADGGVRSKLIDFGIAKMLDSADGTVAPSITKTDEFVGTYTYCSPEQVMEGSSVDGRSDLFSLGILMWEMLSGSPPYAHCKVAYHVMAAVVNEELPPLPDDVPDDLQRLVAELTRKSADERPATADEALDLLLGPTPDLRNSTVVGGAKMPAAPAPTLLDPSPAPTLLDPSASAAGSLEVSTPATTFEPAPKIVPTPIPAPPPPAPDLPVAVEPALPVLAGDPIPIARRAQAHLIDQVLPTIAVLTCVGFPVYPVWMVFRSMSNGRSWGQVWAHSAVFDVDTGEQSSPAKVMLRNGIDLVFLHMPFAVAIWPLALLASSFLSLLLLFWCAAVAGVEFAVASNDPEQRRMLDKMLGTRVGSFQ